MQKTTVKLGYFNGCPNFGDLLNISIPQKIFNVAIEHSSYRDCKAVFIGSILERLTCKKMNLKRMYTKYRKPIVHIWGTGFIQAPQSSFRHMARRVKVHAVRGHISLNRLQKKIGDDLDGVALGDPGLLVSYLVESSEVTKKYRLGVIPHYVDYNNPLLERINVSDSTVIDVRQSPEKVLLQMQECECIISSAMHGLIAADSLRIPNCRLIVSDEVIGGDYKFNDYYSAFGIGTHCKVDLRYRNFSASDLVELKESYSVTDLQVEELCNGLMQSFPFGRLL